MISIIKLIKKPNKIVCDLGLHSLNTTLQTETLIRCQNFIICIGRKNVWSRHVV